MARFWICEVFGGHVLTGHAEDCTVFARRNENGAATPAAGPFASRKLAAAAAGQSSAQFRWCKACQHTGDLSQLAELNAMFEQARVDYHSALAGSGDGEVASQARLKTAADHLKKVVQSYTLFVQRNTAPPQGTEAAG